MIRRIVRFPLALVLLAGFLSLPGCGGGGGEATLEETDAMSAEQEAEAEEYMDSYLQEQQRMQQQQY